VKKQRGQTITRLIGDGARALPEKSHGWFRNWFRKVWKVRGGGLYAFGFAVCFVILEIGSLGDDIADIGSVFNGQAIEFVIQFFIDSFTNTLKSFMWPLYVVQMAPPWGAIVLGLAFVFFAKVLQGPVERWLGPDDSPENIDPQ
jgi:hypothetical protein